MSEYKTLQENQSLNAEYERNKKERELKKEIERLSKNNTILENKLNMIKENIETIDKKTIIEIIDNYTGFWGSDKE